MTDLKNPILIYLKGFLFIVIVICSSILLISMYPSWQTAFLITLICWASARSYYFMFYVIEKYVDSNYKFSGVFSFLKFMIS
ncbi:hypothetical protein QUF70_10155, partial [Desulfobacterales bacterium HSG17]|nr:hypothetical protein [Desulfobacterales bacterium HSG17]